MDDTANNPLARTQSTAYTEAFDEYDDEEADDGGEEEEEESEAAAASLAAAPDNLKIGDSCSMVAGEDAPNAAALSTEIASAPDASEPLAESSATMSGKPQMDCVEADGLSQMHAAAVAVEAEVSLVADNAGDADSAKTQHQLAEQDAPQMQDIVVATAEPAEVNATAGVERDDLDIADAIDEPMQDPQVDSGDVCQTEIPAAGEASPTTACGEGAEEILPNVDVIADSAVEAEADGGEGEKPADDDFQDGAADIYNDEELVIHAVDQIGVANELSLQEFRGMGSNKTAILPLSPPVELPNPTVPRRSYAGVLHGGTFYRRHVESLADLTAKEYEQVYADMVEDRQRRAEAAKRNNEIRKRLDDAAQAKELQRRLSEQEAAEKLVKERKEKKIAEIRKWMAMREAEDRAKKKKMETVLREITELETKKVEEAKARELLEKQRRDRRLAAHHRKQKEMWGSAWTKPRPHSAAGVVGMRQRCMSSTLQRPQTAPSGMSQHPSCSSSAPRLDMRTDGLPAAGSFLTGFNRQPSEVLLPEDNGSGLQHESDLVHIGSPIATQTQWAELEAVGLKELARQTKLYSFLGRLETSSTTYASGVQQLRDNIPSIHQVNHRRSVASPIKTLSPSGVKKRPVRIRPDWQS